MFQSEHTGLSASVIEKQISVDTQCWPLLSGRTNLSIAGKSAPPLVRKNYSRKTKRTIGWHCRCIAGHNFLKATFLSGWLAIAKEVKRWTVEWGDLLWDERPCWLFHFHVTLHKGYNCVGAVKNVLFISPNNIELHRTSDNVKQRTLKWHVVKLISNCVCWWVLCLSHENITHAASTHRRRHRKTHASRHVCKCIRVCVTCVWTQKCSDPVHGLHHFKRKLTFDSWWKWERVGR